MRGTKEAASEQELAQQLRSEGLLLVRTTIQGQKGKRGTSNQPKVDGKKQSGFSKRLENISTVPLVARMIFARHLGVMIRSGFSLAPAIGVLASQTKNKKFMHILEHVREQVEAGKSLSDSFQEHIHIFNQLFVSMIRVGETAGNLDEVLFILADQMKKDHDVRSKVKGAMMYPAVIVVAMVGIGIAMMVFVVPNLAKTLESFGVALPATTQFVIGISYVMSNYTLWIIGGFFVLIVGFIRGRKVLAFKKVSHWLMLRAPIVKQLTQKVNSARFSRIFSSLLKSGVPVVEALEITSRTLSNYYFQSSLADVAKRVQKGERLRENLGLYPHIFPPMVSQMVGVGEESGTLADVLADLAEFFEDEVADTTKNLTSIIEPLIMLVVGGAVGFFALAMMQPMFSLISGVK